MIVDISPVSIAYVASKIEIRMDDFQLGAATGTCTVYYMDGPRVVKAERVEIPEEVYVEWGTDDSFIAQYVLTALNLIAE
jgi:hypothetical protein